MILSSNDITQAGGKKTILPQDVMAALKDAELEAFIPRLGDELKSKSFKTNIPHINIYIILII